ncbi:ATP-binding response regulator [Candidatus Venteria ishoeyi]|uniref:histidine kinase n=1 Tax=Candidatus Venteria ishoeyi TaxID=1899563 RepID=A0A1H6F9F5_9GAMM|nr:hybrid sensor histidine kinase/response regulator [Candidatus Venteria ishoeyi]MDM8545468.1 hybrid sensor histidine kinase/response regulator [Candidatus Venteria ishoeyi]SEH06728.1 Non-motile and phage-resistance protein [Candidatus Venteria ishoeyi]
MEIDNNLNPLDHAVIAVVDDNLTNLNLLRSILEFSECVVHSFVDGNSFLQAMPNLQPDLVLLDIMLPDISGYTLCERLKTDVNTMNIPIIMISALNEVDDKLKAFSMGAVDYISKPFYDQEVLARVATHLKLRALQQRMSKEVEERKAAQQSLQETHDVLETRVAERTEELNELNNALSKTLNFKEEFLSLMSHELHTPLNAIFGLAEALQDGIYGEVTPLQQQRLIMIQKSGKQLLQLIDTILNFSKLSKTQLNLQHAIDLEKIFSDSLAGVAQDAEQKHLVVKQQFNALTQSRVYLDAPRLQQIVDKLLSNAIKFTPEGGEIGLEASLLSAERQLLLTVWDTGIGIKQEDQEKVFQPFLQLDHSLARQYEGLGLGLALVSNLVKLHGGSVELNSKAGAGSRFSIYLPY